jgi:hypothetical protein
MYFRIIYFDDGPRSRDERMSKEGATWYDVTCMTGHDDIQNSQKQARDLIAF